MSEIKPCHTAVLFALGAESGGLEDLLTGLVTIRGQGFTAKEGGWKGRRVVVVRSGAGRANAEAAAETVIDGHRPRWLISAGFAGGLDPALHRHTILLADCVGSESGEWLQIDNSPLSLGEASRECPGVRSDLLNTRPHPNPLPKGEGTDILPGLPKFTVGRLLTLDRVVHAPQEKKDLFAKHAAAAADMETYGAAGVCRRRNVPMLAVRIVLDAAADALPPDIERLLRQPSEAARWGAALRTIWRRPRSLKDLWALKENSLIASEMLAKFLLELIAVLPE
jgi:adenosylhomocysteine nucleosidase